MGPLSGVCGPGEASRPADGPDGANIGGLGRGPEGALGGARPAGPGGAAAEGFAEG